MKKLIFLLLCALGFNADIVQSATANSRLLITRPDAYLVIEGLTEDLVRFETGVGQGPAHPFFESSPMVFRHAFSGPSKFLVQDSPNGKIIFSGNLRLEVSAATLCVNTWDEKRQYALPRICPDNLLQPWKTISLDTGGYDSLHGLGSYFDAPYTTDGNWKGKVWDPQADGFGSRLRGFAGGANNYSMYPILYGLGNGNQNFAFFLDNTYKQMWDFRSQRASIGMWGDEIRWYLFAGDTLQDLRRSYLDLTGRPAVPPQRMFGLWISEFGFSNWSELYGSLETLRGSGFPVDGYALDLQWFGGTFGDPDRSRMGSLRWDEKAFPDPDQNIRKLKSSGVELMLIEEPYIASILPEHRELELRNFLVRDCQHCPPTFLDNNPWWGYGGMLDFTSPAASDFWHDYRRQPLVQSGIAGHWLDLGEPEQYNSWAWYHGFPERNKHAHADVHNIYGFRWVESIARGYQRHAQGTTNLRPQILSRTGTSGVQRFGTAIWSGDIGTNWANLRTQQRVQMQMALSGIDYYGSDVGGFQRPGSDIEGGAESLYTHWFANAAFFDVPVRPHAWNLDKRRPTSPAIRGDKDSNLFNIKLRYQLFPYIYSRAHLAWRFGDPVFPPAFFWHQAERHLRDRGDLKMIGDAILAATITKHQEVAQIIHLPAGWWFNANTGTWINNPDSIAVPTRTENKTTLPLFYRDGAVIPTTSNEAERTNIQQPNNHIRFDFFTASPAFHGATQSGHGLLIKDDGISTNYQQGTSGSQEITASFKWHEPNLLRLAIEPKNGQWDQVSRVTTVVTTPRKRINSVKANGNLVAKCNRARPVKSNCWQISRSYPGSPQNHEPEPNALNTSIEILAVDTAGSTSLAIELETESIPSREISAYFICENAETSMGTSVYVVGGHPSIGNWNPDRGLKMDASAYPTWTKVVHGLPSDQQIQWKCLKKRESAGGSRSEWQPGSNNTFSAINYRQSEFGGVTTGRF